MGRRRHVRLACIVVAAVFSGAGCGSSGRLADEQSRTPSKETTAGALTSEWGNYPADASLDEKGAVEAYVDSLNDRDGRRFCDVVAPWISGRFDIGGTDPEAQLSRPIRCPGFVSGFIGYIEDCCPPEFLGARIVETGDLDRRGDVVGVPITVSLELRDSDQGKSAPTYEEPLHDVVWVTRDSGAWRVAKLSNVAAAASIALEPEGDLEPPDVAADRKAYAAVVAEEVRRRAEREASYRTVDDTASCPSPIRYADGARDIVDWRHPAPRTPTPQLPAADLEAVEVHAAKGEICIAYDLAGDVENRTTFGFSVQSPDFDWGHSGFGQGFDVELRGDGRARVSSGRDGEGHSISVPARVGRDGDRLSLVVDAGSFEAGEPFPGSVDPSRPIEAFKLGAHLMHVLSTRRTLYDGLGSPDPAVVETFTYPS